MRPFVPLSDPREEVLPLLEDVPLEGEEEEEEGALCFKLFFIHEMDLYSILNKNPSAG
jgi:hypothetical protein